MNEQNFPEGKFRISWKHLILILIVVVGMLIGGHYYYVYQKNFILQVHTEFLSAVSSFKVHEIKNWIQERKAEGVFVSSSQEFSALFRTLLRDPANSACRNNIRNWLNPIKHNHEYNNISLFDVKGKEIFSLIEGFNGAGGPGTIKPVFTDFSQGKVSMSEIMKDNNGKPSLTTTAALYDDHNTIGYVVFYIDPSVNLFPTLAAWPVKWVSAENILLHHDPSSTYFLTASQLKPDTIIAFTSPSSEDEITHKIPLQGTFTMAEARDYRGVNVLAEIRHIEGTHWWMISKIDTSELTAPLRRKAVNIILYIVIFIMVITIAGIFVWKSQQLEYYRARFELKKKSELDEEQIRYMNALLQEISDAIITFDKDMIIRSWNKGAERIYGWKAGEVVGKFSGSSLKVDFPGTTRDGIFEELAQKGSWKGEVVHKRKDGSTAYILSSTSQLKDENGNVLGIITINKDISDVIQSEKVKGAVYRISELAHSAKDLNDLFASIHIVIGDLMDASNLFVALLEPNGETISFPYFIDEKDPPPPSRKRGNTLTDIVLRTGKHLLARPEDVQYFIDRGIIDMTRTPAIDWLGVPLKIENETIGALVVQSYSPKVRYHEHEVDVLIFVSEQIALSVQRMKIQQELIVAKQKAEVSSKLTSSLLANMNHELRTPMNGILGFAEILNNELLDPEAKAKAENILISGRRLMDTLDAIMDLSHLESDKVIRKFIPLTIKKVLLMTLAHYEPLIQRKNLTLNINVPAYIQIQGDDYLLQHLFRGLIDNAVKYTEVGSIFIEAREMKEGGQEKVAISFRDTGIGIAKENFELIFETFRQVSEGYGREFEGSGLGLTISKKIVTLFGGQIKVNSKLGEGSEFTVILPALEPSFIPVSEPVTVKPTEKKSHTTLMKENPSVLVVEDNLVNLQLLTLYVSNTYNAYSALDGNTAIDTARQMHFDLILMDINLGPGLNGIQTMLEIRKLSGYKNTPIVALTGYASIGDRDRLMGLGFSAYLPKPVNEEVLLNLMEELLGS
jgi:PAS domain S-box-containing protein